MPRREFSTALQPKKNFYYRGFAFRQRPDGPKLVVFRAPVKEIVLWAQVEQLGPKRTGPQRERKEARVEAIAKFLTADRLVFAHRRPKGKFESVELNQIKTEVKEKLDRLWNWLQRDAQSRLTE